MLNRMPWAEFQDSLDLTDLTDHTNRFAIDMLVVEPNVKAFTLPAFRIAVEEKLQDTSSATGPILLALLQTLPRQRQTYESPLAELCLADKDHYPGISSSALLQS